MALAITRVAGAAGVGIGSAVLSELIARDPENVNLVKVGRVVETLALVGLPLWASQVDGGNVEIGEGAFDGLAALLFRNAGIVAATRPVTGSAQVSNNGHSRTSVFIPGLLTILAPP